jgi:hypothetical protein
MRRMPLLQLLAIGPLRRVAASGGRSDKFADRLFMHLCGFGTKSGSRIHDSAHWAELDKIILVSWRPWSFVQWTLHWANIKGLNKHSISL